MGTINCTLIKLKSTTKCSLWKINCYQCNILKSIIFDINKILKHLRYNNNYINNILFYHFIRDIKIRLENIFILCNNIDTHDLLFQIIQDMKEILSCEPIDEASNPYFIINKDPFDIADDETDDSAADETADSADETADSADETVHNLDKYFNKLYDCMNSDDFDNKYLSYNLTPFECRFGDSTYRITEPEFKISNEEIDRFYA